MHDIIKCVTRKEYLLLSFSRKIDKENPGLLCLSFPALGGYHSDHGIASVNLLNVVVACPWVVLFGFVSCVGDPWHSLRYVESLTGQSLLERVHCVEGGR